MTFSPFLSELTAIFSITPKNVPFVSFREKSYKKLLESSTLKTDNFMSPHINIKPKYAPKTDREDFETFWVKSRSSEPIRSKKVEALTHH